MSDPVQMKPELHTPPATITVDHGDTLRLPCAATAYPLPTYMWYRNGASIDGITHINITHIQGDVMIRNASVNLTGLYRCRAVNSLGSNYVDIKVIVKGEEIPS